MILAATCDPQALLRVARSLQGRVPDMGQEAVATMLEGIATGRLHVVAAPPPLTLRLNPQPNAVRPAAE